MAEVGDIWFRMEDYTTSSYDPYDDSFGARAPRVRLSTYVVVRVTPKGVRLAMWFGDADRKLDEMEMLKLMAGGYITGPRRYVRDAATRRYACPTREEALTSFLARKSKQCAILASRIDNIHASVRLAKAGWFGG